MSKFNPLALSAALLLSLPAAAQAGFFVGVDKDLVNPEDGEQPAITITFDENYFRAAITVTGGGFEQTWNIKPVKAGVDHHYTWKAPAPGEMEYDVKVHMVTNGGDHIDEEDLAYVSSSPPLKASIPAESVDLEARSFDLVTNHPPDMVKLTVIDTGLNELGKSTFTVKDAQPGKPVRVTWEQDGDRPVFRVVAKVYDSYGYWSEVEIVPWSLSIPHEDVNFLTGKHDILAEEAPKVDKAWDEVVKAIEKYGEWVQCSLYIAGYTDTVGDAGSNQALSERRALALAHYFESKGAKFPIYYQGFGESVQAVKTPDSTDEAANRRALYLITGGSPPTGKDTPRRTWKRLQ